MQQEILDFVPYLVIKNDYTIIEAGEKNSEIFNIEKNELIGRRILDFIEDSSIEEFKKSTGNNIFNDTCEINMINKKSLKVNIIHKSNKKILVLEDISFFKKRDVEYLKINSLMENIFNMSSEALRIIDNDNNIIKVNTAYLDLLQLEEDEIIGEKCSNIQFYELSNPEKSSISNNKNNEEKFEREVSTTIGGELRYFILSSKPYIVDNEILGVIESLKEITATKKASQEILKQKEHIELIINNVPTFITYINTDEEYVIVNQQFANAFGIEQKEIIGKKVKDIHSADYQIIKPYINDALSGVQVNYISEFEIHNHGKRWLEVTYAPDIDIDNNVRGFIVLTHDITDLKNYEKDLFKSKERYKLIANNTHDIIWTMDINGKFLFISPSVEKIRGYTVKEALNHSLEESVSQESYPIVKKEFENAKKLIIGGTKSIPTKRFLIDQPHKKGITVKLEIVVDSIFDEKGNFQYFIGVSRDITFRYLDVYNFKNEDFDKIFGHLDGGFSEVEINENSELIFTKVNQAFLEIIDISEEEIIGKKVENIFPNFDKNKFLQNFKINEQNKTFSTSFILEKKSKYLDLYINSIEKNKFYLVIKDTSILRQNAINYIKNEEKYQMITKNVPDVYYSIGKDWKFDYLAGDIESTLGHSEKILKDKDLTVFAKILQIPDNEVKISQKRLAFLISEQRDRFNYDISIIKNGKQAYIENNGKIFYDSEGKILKVNGIIRDITFRKLNEFRINKLSLAVRQSPSSVIITDIDGNIEFVNNKFLEITGYEKEDVIGKNTRILKSGKHPDEVYKNLWETITSGKVWHKELINKKKNGEFFIENAYIYPLKDKNDEIVNFIGLKDDITEKKKIEEDLAREKEQLEYALLMVQEKNIQIETQKDQLIESNATKDKFLNIIGHDLKNPIGSIYNFTNLLYSNYLKYDDEKKLQYLNIINESSKSTYTLIENLLTWARTQTGKIAFEPEIINVADLIKKVTSSLNAQLLKKNITVETSDCRDCLIFADENMMQTVFRNLISNAIKYSNKNQKIEIFYQSTEDYIIINITDYGIGICEENLKNLFKIDKTFSYPGTENEKGTGLGLLLCKEFVEKNHGFIRAESSVGKGSTFFVTLPKFKK